jgi:hypothetical protein
VFPRLEHTLLQVVAAPTLLQAALINRILFHRSSNMLKTLGAAMLPILVLRVITRLRPPGLSTEVQMHTIMATAKIAASLALIPQNMQEEAQRVVLLFLTGSLPPGNGLLSHANIVDGER